MLTFPTTQEWAEMKPEMLTSLRELHSRIADGILVRLLWCPIENRVFVAVNDHKNGGSFSVEVAADERALDVFEHPYAYAAA